MYCGYCGVPIKKSGSLCPNCKRIPFEEIERGKTLFCKHCGVCVGTEKVLRCPNCDKDPSVLDPGETLPPGTIKGYRAMQL